MSIVFADSLRLDAEMNGSQEGTLERWDALVLSWSGSKVVLPVLWNKIGMMTSESPLSSCVRTKGAATDTDRRRSICSTGRDALRVVGKGNEGNASGEEARWPGVDGETGNSSGDLRSRMVMDVDEDSTES